MRDRPRVLNGTYLNGERIWGQDRVRHGDEVRVGTRLLFRNSTDVGHTVTETEDESPSLTPREPSSNREIAAELVVSEAAVKQRLANLYAKFEIAEGATHQRSRLANEALRRGAVTLADLRRGAKL